MSRIFHQMVLQSQEISPIMIMMYILVQEVDAGPPESNSNGLPFELDAKYIYTEPPTYNTSSIVLLTTSVLSTG